jgi:hypothetical protein
MAASLVNEVIETTALPSTTKLLEFDNNLKEVENGGEYAQIGRLLQEQFLAAGHSRTEGGNVLTRHAVSGKGFIRAVSAGTVMNGSRRVLCRNLGYLFGCGV